MARKMEITAQLLDDLFVDAVGGDSSAEDEYRQIVRRLAKRVNQQMREQENADVTGEAYRRAQEFLGAEQRGARFKERVQGIDLYNLQKQADEMISFYFARDYSMPYAINSRREIERILPALKLAGVDIEDSRVTFWMNELFRTSAWSEYKKAHGRSTDLIQSAQDAFRAGKTVDDLIAAYDDYASGRDDAPDLVESWENFAEWR